MKKRLLQFITIACLAFAIQLPGRDAGSIATCLNGAQLAAALANPDVDTALLPSHVYLKNQDFASLTLPVFLQRSFTILGSADRPVTLDMGFVRGKVRLGNGTTFTLRHVVMMNIRSGSLNQAPGIDLLLPMPPGELATVLCEQGGLVFTACFPPAIALQATRLLTEKRPVEIPGVNTFILPAPQNPNCDNSSTVSLMDRCYPYTIFYFDTGMYGADLGPNGSPVPNGHLLRNINMTALCASVLSEDCIARYSAVGCVLYTFSLLYQPPPPPSPPSSLELPFQPLAGGSSPSPTLEGGGSDSAGDAGAGEVPVGGGAATGDGGHASQAGVSGNDGGPGGRRGSAIGLGCGLGGGVVLVAVVALFVAQQRLRVRQQQEQERHHPLKSCLFLSSSKGYLKGRGRVVGDARNGCRSNGTLPDEGEVRSDVIGCSSSWTAAGQLVSADGAAKVPPSDGNLLFVKSASARLAPQPLSAEDAKLHEASAAGGADGAPQTPPVVILPSTPQRQGLQLDALVVVSAPTGAVDGLPAPRDAGAAGGGGDHGGGSNHSINAVGDLVRSVCHVKAPEVGGAGRCGVRGDQDSSDDAVAVTAAPANVGDGIDRGAAAAGVTGDAVGGGGGGGADVVTLLPTVLGRGAFGRVYEGMYRGARVAVKVMVSEEAGGVGAFGGLRMAAEPAPPLPQQQQEQQEQHQQEEFDQVGEPSLPLPPAAPSPCPPSQAPPCQQDSAASLQAPLASQAGAQPSAAVASHGAVGHGGCDESASCRSEQSLESCYAPVCGPIDTCDVPTHAITKSRTGSNSSRHGHKPCGASTQLDDDAHANGSDESKRPVGQQSPRGGRAAAAFKGAHGAARGNNLQLQLFESEVEVLGRCEHPNVVRLLAACLTPPRLCLVMERCETSLERMIYGGGGAGGGGGGGGNGAGEGGGARGRGPVPIPLPKLLHIAIQICQGLEYLHPTIVHRDLKPANVLINGADTERPVAKLADFGLSRIRAMTLPTVHPEAGTPAYTAPECYDVDNYSVTHHVDMYSLGVLLWAMLTGQVPWKDHNVVAVAYKVAVLGERPPLHYLSASRCPPKLRWLIQQCWDADPLRRPAAAEAVKELHLIQRALNTAPPTSGAGSRSETRHGGGTGVQVAKRPETPSPRRPTGRRAPVAADWQGGLVSAHPMRLEEFCEGQVLGRTAVGAGAGAASDDDTAVAAAAAAAAQPSPVRGAAQHLRIAQPPLRTAAANGAAAAAAVSEHGGAGGRLGRNAITVGSGSADGGAGSDQHLSSDVSLPYHSSYITPCLQVDGAAGSYSPWWQFQPPQQLQGHRRWPSPLQQAATLVSADSCTLSEGELALQLAEVELELE